MAVTINDVVLAAITELSQVPGLATQIYSTPVLQQFVQNAILLEIEEMWWPPLMYYQLVPLDPSTGLLANDLIGPISKVDEYGDIAAVYQDGRNTKIPELPQSINPFALTSSGSAAPRFISADATIQHRPFRVWPAGSSGNVVVWARQRPPTPMGGTDLFYLDQLLILYDACWMYAVDDGTVPAQVNKYQMLAAKRRQAMKARYSTAPLLLDPRFPNDWALDGGIDQGFFTLDVHPLA